MENHDKHIRVFIAISLPKHIIQFLKQLQQELKKRDSKASWPSSQNLHLTLKFIGDLHPDKIGILKKCMQHAVLHTRFPIKMSVSGIGVFPNMKRARVIWAGIQGEIDLLEQLASSLSKKLSTRIDIKIEKKKFVPHLTIARIKKPIPLKKLQHMIQAVGNVQSKEFIAPDIKLFKSELKSTGAVHTEIFRCR